MKTVLNKRNYDILAQPMFLGKDLGTQRFDIIKYPVFSDLNDKMVSYLWAPSEINLINDRTQFESMNETERFVFTENLKFQTMGDSLLSRSIDLIKQHVTNTELEYCFTTQAYVEQIHSKSYTWILQNITDNPTEFFDSILENEHIVARAEDITESFDALLGKTRSDRNIKETIFKSILSLQIAEGLFFYSSFACSFWFGSRGIMRGNADIIKLISKDEHLHLSITQNILKKWKNDESEGFKKVMDRNEDLIYETYRLAVTKEKEWAEHLFSKGSLIGLNEKILSGYIEWLANLRLTNLGYKKLYDQKENPLRGWINEYSDSSKTASMPQESEITSYVKGSQNVNVDFEKLKKIEL